MLKQKRSLSILLVMLMAAVMLAGCSGTPSATTQPAASTAPAEEATTAPAETASAEASAEATASPATSAAGEVYIPVISKGFQHQFWQAVKKGAENAATDYGVKITFEGPESETQVDKQIDMLNNAMAKNPQAICLAALDTQAVLPQLEQAKAANIPVVGFDSGVDSDIPVSTASTDNKAAAAAAADKMAELIGKEGEVAIIVHDQTSTTGQDRRDGFKEQIESKYPNIKIVDIQYGEGDHAKSADIAKSIIAAHPNLKGIFGGNEGSAVGALQGVKEAGMAGKIVLIGFDSSKALKDGIRAGEMAGAISQDPVAIGYKAVEAAFKAYKGEPVDKVIDTGFKWYDKTNVDSADMKDLLYD